MSAGATAHCCCQGLCATHCYIRQVRCQSRRFSSAFRRMHTHNWGRWGSVRPAFSPLRRRLSCRRAWYRRCFWQRTGVQCGLPASQDGRMCVWHWCSPSSASTVERAFPGHRHVPDRPLRASQAHLWPRRSARFRCKPVRVSPGRCCSAGSVPPPS